MNNIKKKIKYFLFGAIALIVLLVFGVKTINEQSRVEETVSTFELTSFDYLINGTSLKQIDELKNNKEAIKSVFPAVLVNAEIKSSTANKQISLLLSDDMDNFETGLLNEKLKITGNYNEDGLMLDKTAADALKVSVGDTVSYTLSGKSFTIQVAAIYRSCTYSGFNMGLGELKWTNEHTSIYKSEKRYSTTFIEANDSEACKELLSNYVGLLGIEEYSIWKEKHKDNVDYSKMITESDEEYDIRLKEIYSSEYYEPLYQTNKQKYQVQEKKNFAIDAKEQTIVLTENINFTSYLAAILTPIIFLLVYIIFMSSEKKENTYLSASGQDMKSLLAENILPSLFISISIFLITLITLSVLAASKKIEVSNYPKIILLFTLPTLVGTIVVYPIIYLNIKKYYSSLDDYKYDFFAGELLGKEKNTDLSHINPKDGVVSLRKHLSGIYSFLISIVSFFFIFFIFSTTLSNNYNDYLKYKNTDNISIAYTLAPFSDENCFENLNGKAFVLNNEDEQINADILSTIDNYTYNDNLIGFDCNLESNEAAVSENIAKMYNLHIGSTLKIKSTKITYRISFIIKSQQGFDNLYQHKGVIVLNHDDSLSEYIENIKKAKTYTTFAHEINSLSLDDTRKEPLVSVLSLRLKALAKTVLTIIYAALSFLFIFLLIELFITRNKYIDLTFDAFDGMYFHQIMKKGIFSNLLSFGLPLIIISLLFIMIKDISLFVPAMMYIVLILAMIALYSYFRINKIMPFTKQNVRLEEAYGRK